MKGFEKLYILMRTGLDRSFVVQTPKFRNHSLVFVKLEIIIDTVV